MFKNGRHSEFKITPHQSPMIIRGQNTIKDSMGGMEAIHSTTITSFLSKLGAHPTENNHQPLSLIHKQFDSLLSPAPTRAQKLAQNQGEQQKGVTFGLGPTGASYLYGACPTESGNAQQNSTARKHISAKKLFQSPPSSNSNEKSSSSSRQSGLQGGSSGTKYGSNQLERFKSSDAYLLGKTSKHLKSITKGSQIFSGKQYDIQDDQMAATPFNPHSSISNLSLQNPIDSLNMPLDQDHDMLNAALDGPSIGYAKQSAVGDEYPFQSLEHLTQTMIIGGINNGIPQPSGQTNSNHLHFEGFHEAYSMPGGDSMVNFNHSNQGLSNGVHSIPHTCMNDICNEQKVSAGFVQYLGNRNQSQSFGGNFGTQISAPNFQCHHPHCSNQQAHNHQYDTFQNQPRSFAQYPPMATGGAQSIVKNYGQHHIPQYNNRLYGSQIPGSLHNRPPSNHPSQVGRLYIPPHNHGPLRPAHPHHHIGHKRKMKQHSAVIQSLGLQNASFINSHVEFNVGCCQYPQREGSPHTFSSLFQNKKILKLRNFKVGSENASAPEKLVQDQGKDENSQLKDESVGMNANALAPQSNNFLSVQTASKVYTLKDQLSHSKKLGVCNSSGKKNNSSLKKRLFNQFNSREVMATPSTTCGNQNSTSKSNQKSAMKKRIQETNTLREFEGGAEPSSTRIFAENANDEKYQTPNQM